MKKGYVMSGKLGILPSTRMLGAAGGSPGANAGAGAGAGGAVSTGGVSSVVSPAFPGAFPVGVGLDTCPYPYTRNIFGVCVGPAYPGPVVLAGRR